MRIREEGCEDQEREEGMESKVFGEEMRRREEMDECCSF